MIEEKEIEEFNYSSDNELLSIIDEMCVLLSTLADISDSEYRTYDDELADLNTCKSTAYRVIHAAQKKLIKYVKQYEQGNTDNKEV